MADERVGSLVASINDINELVTALRSGALREIVSRVSGGTLKDCSGYCECVNRMCGCNNSVSREAFTPYSYPEFLELREARMRELKAQLDALETPPGVKK